MIIITAPVHEIMIETFEKKGLKYMYLPDSNYNNLFEIIDQATGIVVATQIKIDEEMIDKAVQLKWIGRIGSGMEHIDVAYAKQKNIICVSSPEGNSNAVAEHALGILLSLLRNINKSNSEIKVGKWLRSENRGTEISGKVVGIIGYGNTGTGFAKLLSSFDVTILAYDKYKFGYGNEKVIEASLEQIASQADMISFHLPLTEETFHLGNSDFFKSLKNKPYILNTSRGKVLDTGALISALENNLISGAGLDVLENEQLFTYDEMEKKNFDFLNKQNNVILTPHIAGYSHEAVYKMSKILLEKLDFI
jgi:D-3-phosphoglycerate dehydrogenase